MPWGFSATQSERTPSVDVKGIIALNTGLREFWSQSHGWAPQEAANLLAVARLDRQVSLSHTLNRWIGELDPAEAEGALILAYANLRSLVEGTMRLFLSVYLHDYSADPVKHNKSGDMKKVDEEISLEEMRVYMYKRGLLKRDWINGLTKEITSIADFNEWIQRIQRRGNAIHAFKDREIGNLSEFHEDLRRYLEFVAFINDSLPYPDDIYKPRTY